MEDSQHPLHLSPFPRGDVSSPAPNQVDGVQSNLRAHRDSLTNVVTRFEQAPPFNESSPFQQQDLPPRGRSKSLAVNFFDRPSTGIPYKAKTWEPTLEKAIKAIISIKASHVRSFDTETSGNEQD
jgi:hypothetical protein